ncbi:MAG: hypothetical protein Q8916_07305 [Bacteroidota bacterium]|nr:hypothetical protein [Bacteroidota bacterium]
MGIPFLTPFLRRNQRSLRKSLFVFVFIGSFVSVFSAQTMRPQDLARDYLVKLVMNDSSQFYGIVLQKPLPDRILFQTRNGRLEIPLKDINYAVDYRFNFVMNSDLKKDALTNATDVEKYHLSQLLSLSKLESPSVVHTTNHDIFRGYRYLFDDTAHVIISTDWGELYFRYPDLQSIDNYSGTNDRRKEFYTPTYLSVKDPMASQGFVTPNGIPFGQGNNFLSDYLLGGLQINFGPTDWLSLNLGGVFLPLKTNITVATGGAKFTPLATDLWHASIGAQGMYSEVVKTTKLLLGYGAVTYGDWESQLTLFGGYTINHTDSLGYKNTKNDELLAVQGALRVGENLKLGMEFFFISNFGIVPVLISMRYFENNLTIDIGVVFSLYKSGEDRTSKTIGEYVFNVPDFPLVPVISGSFHF